MYHGNAMNGMSLLPTCRILRVLNLEHDEAGVCASNNVRRPAMQPRESLPSVVAAESAPPSHEA